MYEVNIKEKVVIFGGSGQIGWELIRCLSTGYEIFAPSKSDVDFLQPLQIQSYLNEQKPQIIINAAGYTDVDSAEQETEDAKQINAEAVGILSTISRKLNSLLIHYSTDYVFDGQKDNPYDERDAPGPINLYGKTKLDGERYIQQVGGRFLILRTGWIYGWRRSNFLLKILNLAKQDSELPIVVDQKGNPTWCRDIALATCKLLDSKNTIDNKLFGVYHATNSGVATRYEWASEIVSLMKLDSRVKEITSDNHKTRALRPANSALDSSRLAATFNIYLPNWQESLNEMIGSGGIT